MVRIHCCRLVRIRPNIVIRSWVVSAKVVRVRQTHIRVTEILRVLKNGRLVGF